VYTFIEEFVCVYQHQPLYYICNNKTLISQLMFLKIKTPHISTYSSAGSVENGQKVPMDHGCPELKDALTESCSYRTEGVLYEYTYQDVTNCRPN
jgi:hypothetical protein